jgi:diguanylate cyclase (GGDEF)-like protein/PAS domain S-box-containing protein
VTIEHWARTMEPGKRVVKTKHQDPDDERSFEHVSHVERVCLHNLLESSSEAIYFKDLENRFLLISKGVMQHHIERERKNGASENLDLGPDYYLGKTDLDLYDTELATEWMAEERRIIETAEPMVDVLERDSSDAAGGGWFRTSKAPLRDEDGTIIGTFGISRDVTAQVVAEQELARREAQLRAVLDSSPDVMACYNKDLRYEMINAKAAVLLGTTPEQVVGRTDEELERPAEVLALLVPALKEVIETKEAREVEFPSQVGEQTIWWHARMVPQLSGDGVVTGVVMAARDLTQIKAVQTVLAHQALHDHLTGLANRLALMGRLSTALGNLRSNPGRIVLLFIDLDNFKLINDAYGHDVGDEVLAEVASRLRGATRRADMVARLGGDEFVMLFDILEPDKDARTLANRALRSLRKGFVHDGETLCVTASIGAVVISDPETNVDDVLRDADIAMYSAKAKGKNQIALFQPVMTDWCLNVRREPAGFLERSPDLRAPR